LIESLEPFQISKENVDIVGLQEVRINDKGENQLYQLQQTPQLREKHQYALYASLLLLLFIMIIIPICVAFILWYELASLTDSVRIYVQRRRW
jgi:hypothetical protein